ncbi:hypothetical protein RclHR1_17070004 [Rhizophagus clarus]|uniref:SAM domain-containing protein n=1 Tax=Rhizophagus clarus TaxID=94130 RepID=A0A2Z6QKI1_9GLOM|nr:hypothetical protein RclHR1_17070004 [Rhizophagus clarus]
MFTSTAEHDSYLVENWDTETLINFLKEQNLKLEEKHFNILRNEEITGLSFLNMTEEKLRSYGFKGGLATLLAKEVQALKEKPKRAFFSYKSLKEVLAKYGTSSDGMETIPLFSPEIHEVQDFNKHFEHCIENILFRMKNYRSLVLDSLESMRNEYVSTILHIALHIVGDIVSKEFSMRPEYEIIGDESCGRVNYAIKEAKNLICITEDKVQRSVLEGFTQNIKQLESSPGKISQASELPFTIEFNKKALDKDSEEYVTLCKGVLKVLGIMLGLLKDRACAEEEPERKRIISSDLELLKQSITELEAKNAKLEAERADLKKENTDLRNKLSVSDAEIAELKRSNIKFLRANKEYNERRDAENAKLRARIEELESENIEFNSGAVHHEKLLEEKEMDSFLLEAHKKIVGEDIRQRRREKKLQVQESLPAYLDKKMPQEIKCPTSDPVTRNQKRVTGSSRSHKKKGMDELKHELFNSPSESDGPSSINHNNVIEVSEIAHPGKVTYNSIDEASQHLAQLCDKAINTEDRANRANQEEILCCVLYDTITEQFSILRKKRSQELGLKLRDVSWDSLRKKTQKAEKNYKLFEKVGLDKIKYINSYSANSISELTDAQFQEIIDYGISLEKLSPEAGHVSEISETARPKKILPEINTPSTPQITPAKANDNDLTNLKEEDFCGGEVVIASVSSAYRSFLFSQQDIGSIS